MGGGPGAPHFNVQEFGGSVYWYNARGGHVIPIGTRVNVTTNRSGNRRGAEGKFFWPTTREHAPDFGRYVAEDAVRIVHETLNT
jgi:hypothetical protein